MHWIRRLFKFFYGDSRRKQCCATIPSTLSDGVWSPGKAKDDVRALQFNCPQTGSAMETLAKEQSFDELVFILTDDRIDITEWLMRASSCHGESVDLCLHTLLKYQPPLPLVSLLCNKLREMKNRKSVPEAACRSIPEAARDDKGRTALHVACAYGCSIVVVARMMNGATAEFQNPAAELDASRMLPLHWACNRAGRNDLENMQHVIGFLVKAYPDGVFMRDVRGRTPTDLSIQHKLDSSILRILHRAKCAKRNKRRAQLDQTHSIPTEICIMLGRSEDEDDGDDGTASLLNSRGQESSSALSTISDQSMSEYGSMVLETSRSPKHKDIHVGRGTLTENCPEERDEYSNSKSHILKGDQDWASVEELTTYFGLINEPAIDKYDDDQLASAFGDWVQDPVANGVVDSTHVGRQHDNTYSNEPQFSSAQSASKLHSAWERKWERRFREFNRVVGDDSSQKSQHTERTASETSKTLTSDHTLQRDSNQGIKVNLKNEGHSTEQVRLRCSTVNVMTNDWYFL